MSRPGVRLIPFNGNKTTLEKVYPCICGKPECAALSESYRKVGDIRGTFTRTPTANKTKKSKKAERFRRHLCPQKTIKEICTVDNRGKKNNPGIRTRRQAEQEVEEPGRQIKYVAWHHFDPCFISQKALTRKGKYVCVDTVPDAFVKSVIQSDGESNGYTDADRFDKKFYFAVPSYPLSKASGDLEEVEKNTRLQVLTDEVAAAAPRSSRRASPANQTHGPQGPPTAPDRMDQLMKENLELKEKLQVYEETIRFLNESTQEPSPQQSSENGTTTVTNSDQFTELKFQGVNRMSVASDEYHAAFPKACACFFRFESWELLKDFIEDMHDLPYERPDKRKGLSKFEQCLLTLFYIESGCNLQFIAQVYGFADHTTVSKIVNAWVPVWGEVGRHLSILPGLTSAVMDELVPQSYIDLGLEDVGAILDGKDWYTETVRKDRAVAQASHGNKLKHSSFRVMTWSLLCGINFEHTHAFLARASEKKLVQLWGRYGKLKNIPACKQVLADKGFDQTTGFYPNHNTVLHPAFLHGHKQFSPEQNAYNLRVCQLRYSCETVYAHVTKCTRLYGFVPRREFHHFQHICDWGHGRANLYLPLQMPAKHVDYFEDNDRYQANECRKRKRSNNHRTRK